jgi:hypothetical protein
VRPRQRGLARGELNSFLDVDHVCIVLSITASSTVHHIDLESAVYMATGLEASRNSEGVARFGGGDHSRVSFASGNHDPLCNVY